MHQIGTSIRTIVYFTLWGLFYGGVLGCISGTLIFPLWGTLFATGWGVGIGFVLGIVAGAITAAAQLGVQFRDDGDFRFFRRSLSIVTGAITALAAPILIVLTSGDLLWYRTYDYYGESGSMSVSLWMIPVVIAAVVWGYLAAAHTTSRSVDLFMGEGYKRPPVLPLSAGNLLFWTEKMVAKGWLYFLVGMSAGALNYLNTQGMQPLEPLSPMDAVGLFVVGFAGGAIVSLLSALLLVTANSVFITFLNRLIFYEYTPQMSLALYRRCLRIISFIFTLCVGMMVSAVVFVPLMAIAASMIAVQYAEFTWTEEQRKHFRAQVDDDDDLFLPIEDNAKRRVHIRKSI